MLKLNSPSASTLFVVLGSIALFAVLFSTAAFAQTSVSTGSIVGNVTDTTGAVLPNVKVTATGPTGQTLHTTTNGSGEYSFGALIPGAYTVRAEAKGFKTAQVSLEVKVDNAANGRMKLEIGQESTVVEVQASDLQVNTEQATVQGVLTANQIENLPVNGRNFLDLAQLEPGVQIQDGQNFDPTKAGFSSISFGGRFGRTARIEVDGVDVSDETVGTTTTDIPASAIQEFQVSQSSLDMSSELTSSGSVNVTTKSGPTLSTARLSAHSATAAFLRNCRLPQVFHRPSSEASTVAAWADQSSTTNFSSSPTVSARFSTPRSLCPSRLPSPNTPAPSPTHFARVTCSDVLTIR